MLRKRLGTITTPSGDNLQCSSRSAGEDREMSVPNISTDLVTTKVAAAEASGKEESSNGCINVEERESTMLPLLKKDDNNMPPVSTSAAVAKAEVLGTSAATVSSASPYVSIDSCAKQVERRPCIGAVLVSVNGVRIQVGTVHLVSCTSNNPVAVEGVIFNNHSFIVLRGNDDYILVCLALVVGVEFP